MGKNVALVVSVVALTGCLGPQPFVDDKSRMTNEISVEVGAFDTRPENVKAMEDLATKYCAKFGKKRSAIPYNKFDGFGKFGDVRWAYYCLRPYNQK